MDIRSVEILVVFHGVAYGLGFGAAKVVVEILSGPWRRAAEAHWTERARLAFAPGTATVWLGMVLAPWIALVGGVGVQILEPGLEVNPIPFWTPWAAALAGILTARYWWLRELWGARVTPRSWLAGCLVLLLAHWPHLTVWMVLMVVLPEVPSAGGAWMFCGGVVATGLLAMGGGIRLLRLLRVVKEAPAPVAEMVGQLAGEMRVPGRVKVYVLEWAQVNALAWVLYRGVGFSRAMIEVLDPPELRAIAAHELAHLLEPGWVRAVRVMHMFAYLALLPLIRYGGGPGLAWGWMLVLLLVFGYQRFSRRMEERADRLERVVIADSGPYMRALIRIHEANLLPAVMPGAQTHPHLYDRLLAGGIQPEFPRPAPPPRTRLLLAVGGAVAAVSVLMLVAIIGVGVIHRLMAPG